MAKKTIVKTSGQTRTVKKETKLEKIQAIYGTETAGVSLEQTKKHLDKIGFKSLGKILQPAKQ